MSFVSLVFFPFLFIYFVLSTVVSQRTWLWITAVASAIFYAYWDWRFLFLLYYVCVVSWYCGRRIASAATQRERKLFVVVSIVSCLTVLGIFKYFDFFTTSFSAMMAAVGLGMRPEILGIALPVGISFYTFHALSYTIDIYRRKIERSADFLSVAVYLSFFPQLVAGPIVRAHKFLPQIARGPLFVLRKIRSALLIIAWGYFLKIAVADSIGQAVDPIFADPASASTGDLIFAIVAYSFQIYGDFAGYSFIAIGVAKLQGFDFPANFLAPYFSRSFSEFWRRWHISLSSFLRDYLYIPLGGNRHGHLQEYRNLFLTMFLGGLWHGASLNFVFWGSLHGLYLMVQRLLRGTFRHIVGPHEDTAKWRLLHFGNSAIKMLGTYCLVMLAWVFFRNRDFSTATAFLSGIAAWQGAAVVHMKFQVVKIAILILITVIVDAIFIERRRVVVLRNRPAFVSSAIAILCCLTELFGSFGGGAFIYFQF